MKHFLSLAIVLAIILISATGAFATEARTLTLENGLDLVLMPDATSPLLSSLVVVRAGSSYETLASAGSTHLLEHMIFRGTETRTQGQIYDGMDLMGAYYNAWTNKTSTNFILVVGKENAKNAMEIQADMILHSTIPSDTFEVEKGRVVAEIQQTFNRDDTYPGELANLRNVFGTTSYSFPVLGSVEGIKALTREAVASFHEDWYHPNNMTLVLRGDLSFSEMEKLAREVYGSEPAKQLPERPQSFPEGFESWQSNQVHTFYGTPREGVLYLTIPAPRFDEAAHPTLSIMSDFIQVALSSLSDDSSAGIKRISSDLIDDPNFSVFQIYSTLKPGSDPEYVVERILLTLSEFAKTPFKTEDLAQALESTRLQRLFFEEQVQYGSFFLAAKLALAPYGFWQSYEKRSDMISDSDAAWVANQYFKNPNWIATAYLPEQKSQMNSGVSFGPIEVDTLSNGMVLVSRQATGVPVTGIHLVAKDRTLREGKERQGWADILHRLLLKGYGSKTKQDLQVEIDQMGMKLSTVDGPLPMDDYRTTTGYSFIRLEVLPDRWAGALKLLGNLFTEPVMSEALVASATAELSSKINRSKGKLSSTVRKKFYEMLLGSDHPVALGVYGDGTSLASLDSSALKSFRDEYFAANNLVIAVISPAQHDELVKVLDESFGKLSKQNLLNKKSPAPQSAEITETVTGSGRQGYLATGFQFQVLDKADIAALKVANSMVSDLIYRDLGEKKGWAYGAGSRLTVSDDFAWFSSTMGLPSEHLEESQEAVYAHLKRIAEGDFDHTRFETGRQSLLGHTLRRYSSRINLAMALSRDMAMTGNPNYTWDLYDQISALEIEDVKRVAKKYLKNTGPIVTVYGKPDPNAKKKMPKGMMGMPKGMGMMGH